MKQTVFDMGAHKGEDSAYFLRRGFRVVAFECNPELVELLHARFAHAIHAGDLLLVDKAVAPTSGTAVFYKHAESVLGTVSSDWTHRNSSRLSSDSIAEVTVEAITPAECFETYGIPYYLKIDVEGVDHEVLEALTKFDQRPTYVSIESEKSRLAEPATGI